MVQEDKITYTNKVANTLFFEGREENDELEKSVVFEKKMFYEFK